MRFLFLAFAASAAFALFVTEVAGSLVAVALTATASVFR